MQKIYEVNHYLILVKILEKIFLTTFVNINNQTSFVLDFTLFVQLSDPLNKITCEIQKNRYFSSLILFGGKTWSIIFKTVKYSQFFVVPTAPDVYIYFDRNFYISCAYVYIFLKKNLRFPKIVSIIYAMKKSNVME